MTQYAIERYLESVTVGVTQEASCRFRLAPRGFGEWGHSTPQIYIHKRRMGTNLIHDWPTPPLILSATSSVPIRRNLEG